MLILRSLLLVLFFFGCVLCPSFMIPGSYTLQVNYPFTAGSCRLFFPTGTLSGIAPREVAFVFAIAIAGALFGALAQNLFLKSRDS